jgi:hypothetical protein
MALSPEAKQRIQIALALAIVVAGVRTAFILYQRRHESLEQRAQRTDAPLQADYYVTPKKLYPYDLKSAKQLNRQPVWVKEGYRYTYYPFDSKMRRADFSQQSGTLGPIERLQIQDVVADRTPGAPNQRQLVAVFEKGGGTYAVPIGTEMAGTYQIYSDEMFYIQDPHDLYKHWPPEIWQEIEKHQVKEGMNEYQAGFALGVGIPERSSDPSEKTVNYPNGGKPVSITYRKGRAESVRMQGKP